MTALLLAAALPHDGLAKAAADDEAVKVITSGPLTAPTTQPAEDLTGKVAQSLDPREVFLKRPGTVGWLKLQGPVRDGPPPFAWVAESGRRPSLAVILAQLKHVAQDAKSKGVVLALDEPQLSWAQIDEISAAIAAIRAADKKVVVVSQQYDTHTYLLACAADRILLQHKGVILLNGLGMEEMYLAGLLEKIGLKADFVQVGKYKGADEQLTRTGPSPEWSQTIDALLDDMYAQMIERISQSRGLSRGETVKAIAECWTMSDQDYVSRKLVDQLADRTLTEVTEQMYGEAFAWDQDMGNTPVLARSDNPLMFLQMLMQDSRPRINRDTIAVIHASGVIESGDSRASGQSGGRAGLFGGASIGSRTMEKLLDSIADNEHIKGVILRIDSPGGSAIASEMIWQAVRRLGEKKPVYVSIGAMAASGGYYIACAGHEIYASPHSIIGSIGVVGGKIVLGGLYERLGVGVYQRNRGPMADMFNSTTPFTREQKAALESVFNRTYEQFLDRVTTGRGKRLDREHVADVAQGRVFTGRAALNNHLIDKVGGIELCLADLVEDLELKAGAYDVVNLPEPMTLPEYLDSIFGVNAQAPAMSLAATQLGELGAARALLGDRAWSQAEAALSGLMLLRSEHVITLMPTVIDVH
ncbi:MAG: signal peptide peptidase SppA [Phycisphaeraceae bacterium]